MPTAAAGKSISHGHDAPDGQAAAALRGQQPVMERTISPGRPSRRRGISYRSSLVLSLSLLVVGTGLVVSLLSFRGALSGITELAHTVFQEVSDHVVTKTRGFLQRAVPIAQSLGNFAELGLATDDHERLGQQLAMVLRANPGVSWISYSDEQGAFVGAYRHATGDLRVNISHIDEQGRTPVIEHDVLEDGSWRLFRTEADSGFDPRRRPFYVRAKEAGRLVWPPPYVFYDQGVPGVTCANPLYDRHGRLQGVLTVDFDLHTLSHFIDQLSVSPDSRMFIMDADGTILAHPEHRRAATPGTGPGRRGRGELLTVQTLDDPLIVAFDAELLPEDRTPGDGGQNRARQFDFRHDGIDYFARSTAFSIDGDLVWIVGVIAPQADFLAAARRTTAIAASASVAAMLLAVVVAIVLARRVSGPIEALVSFMDGVRGGDLGRRIQLGGAREFRHLSEALDRMLDDLRDRLRLRSDMAVAMQVQHRLLPARPPRIDGLDVYGFSAYCDETGGDYFDYLPRKHQEIHDVPEADGGLLVVIGDVVGHGIGSAIIMAGARGVLHSRTTARGDLGELMTHLNDQLVPDTGGSRYVTMLLWYIHPRTGTACWANAGHDPALIYDPQTAQWQTAAADGDIPLGIEPGLVYREQPFAPVGPGQVIVLGTDGIWETVNSAGEPYGKARLMQAVRAAAHGSAEQIAESVRRDLDAFRGSGRQRDDVTLVVIKVLKA